jgi:hypothetical protein
MTIEQLGNLGEFIAAIATLATLAYLAVQVRHNTKALRASTFQQVSEAMAQNVSHLTDNDDLAAIALKVSVGDDLAPVERLRYQGLILMSMRRLESIYHQHRLGSINADQVKGFELSMISLVKEPIALEWWGKAKITFDEHFVEYVDKRLMGDDIFAIHPSMSLGDN